MPISSLQANSRKLTTPLPQSAFVEWASLPHQQSGSWWTYVTGVDSIFQNQSKEAFNNSSFASKHVFVNGWDEKITKVKQFSFWATFLQQQPCNTKTWFGKWKVPIWTRIISDNLKDAFISYFLLHGGS